MKTCKLLAASLLAVTVLAACSDDSPSVPQPPVSAGGAGVYVINQGNYYGGVSGTVDALSFADSTYAENFFESANGISVGDSPQQGVAYGSKIYIPVYASNLVWVLDKSTLNIVASVTTNGPEAVCGAGGYVFIANNDGYVSRLDTLTHAIDRREEVGPNPAGLAALDGKVYATISDGYNYDDGYVNGLRVAVVDVATGEKTGDIAVGLNPGQIVAEPAGRYLFVVCRGNYDDVAAKVQRIAPEENNAVTDFAGGGMVAVTSAGQVAVVSMEADYAANKAQVTSNVYDARTGTVVVRNLLDANPPAMPASIDANPLTGEWYVCSDKGPNDYDKRGVVYVYSRNGSLLRTYEAGIHPVGVIFR